MGDIYRPLSLNQDLMFNARSTAEGIRYAANAFLPPRSPSSTRSLTNEGIGRSSQATKSCELIVARLMQGRAKSFPMRYDPLARGRRACLSTSLL
ncbi:hypothetical protein XI05_18500 [Bradyrhizobium sp. CCBAU 11357]|nr:hypothetical protein [Bradyrhizobium sp. CCBAU 11357]